MFFSVFSYFYCPQYGHTIWTFFTGFGTTQAGMVGVGAGVSVNPGVVEASGVTLGIFVGVGVLLIFIVGVGVSFFVGVGVTFCVGVGVSFWVGVGVAFPVGVGVGFLVGVGVILLVGVADGDFVRVGEGVFVAVAPVHVAGCTKPLPASGPGFIKSNCTSRHIRPVTVTSITSFGLIVAVTF